MYLKWKEITAPDLSDATLTTLYTEGFVLTRKGRGEMDQTRSLRIDLSKFVLSSENRRVLKKTEGLELEVLPLPYADYTWEIGKLGKDFYEDKFGTGTFSANKIKELLTDEGKSNFNTLLVYRYTSTPVGYTITYQNSEILHYSYPFYDRATEISNLGLGMMLRAILHAQETGKKYIYLGSAQRPTDIYKLQFAGLEWFDGETWQTETEGLKNILTTEKDSVNASKKNNMENKQEKIKSSVDWKQFCKAFGKAILCMLAIYIILISIVFIYTTITTKHRDPNSICGPSTICENSTGNFVCSTNSFKDSTLYRCNLAGYTVNLASAYIFMYYLGLFMIIMTLPLSIMLTITQGNFALLFSVFSLITFLPYLLLSGLTAWFYRTHTK